MDKGKNIRLKELTRPLVDVGTIDYPNMLAFFDSLHRVVDGSYRRVKFDFTNKKGETYTATVYRCGRTMEEAFVRIDLKKLVYNSAIET